MSTSLKINNVLNIEIPSGKGFKVALLTSQWNPEITKALENGARSVLLASGIHPDSVFIHTVPGTYELPLAAQLVLEGRPETDAVICTGCVIQGETPHFDYICQAAAQGIKDVGLKYNKPVIFNVLTTLTHEQAVDRAGGKYGNKGEDAGMATLQMLHLKTLVYSK